MGQVHLAYRGTELLHGLNRPAHCSDDVRVSVLKVESAGDTKPEPS